MEREISVVNEIKKQQKFLGGDASRIIFLVCLYITQGLSFGFLGSSLPIILKKNFSYSDIGFISWWGLPYTLKFIFAPLIDSKYSRYIGKRRSWIIPTQIVMGAIIMYLAQNIEQLIEQKNILFIMLLFLAIYLWCALQDISIDGWCVTIVREENSKYAALAQIVGIDIGIFLSTTLFIAFSSVEFWNNYIYSVPQEIPLMDQRSFFNYWSMFIFIIWIYTILFSNEKYDRIKYDDKEVSIGSVLKLVFKFAKSEQMIKLLILFVGVRMFSSVNNYVGGMYLFENLKYSKTKYSIISLIVFPVNTITSIIIIKYASSKILNTFLKIVVLKIINDIIVVNVIFYLAFNELTLDCMIFFTSAVTDFVEIGLLTGVISYANLICDPKVASTQLTFIFSMWNLSNMLPKLYTYFLIEEFGIFSPNIIGSIITLVLLFFLNSLVKCPRMYSRVALEDDIGHIEHED